MAKKTVRVWYNKELFIPWHGGDTSDDRTIRFVWNPDYTDILSAEVRVVARANGRTNLKIRMNDSEVILFHWEIWEDMKTKSGEADATALLENGDNLFIAEFYKDIVHPADVRTIFSVTLVVEYEGDEPEEKPWWEKYVIPALAGTSVVLGAIGVAKAFEKKEEKK